MKIWFFAIITLISFNLFAADAKVVATEPVYTNSTQYREVCTPVTETRRSIGGTLLGGAIGAAAGNQVGGGSGKDIATVLGAVTGAAIGQNVAGDRTVTKNQCTSEPFTVQEVSQYKVTVDINGNFYTVYRSFSPQTGSLIPVTLSVN
jgi:uncharacterized protein YcfJ